MAKTKTSKKKVQVETPRIECSDCKKSKVESDFYLSNNELFNINGRFPICKPCLKKRYDFNNVESVKELLMQMNRPFLYTQWNSAVEELENSGKKDILGVYLKTIYLNFKTLTWKDSEFGEVITPDKNNKKTTQKSSDDGFAVTDDLMEKWGVGYTQDEYKNFERKYNKLINNYGEKTALHTEGLITYIRYRVKEEMATAQNLVKDAKEWGQLASKAAQDAKINVSQLSKSDISGGVDVLSQLFEAVESEVGVIPLLPHLLEQPYDDADMIIWATINYNRRLEDKPFIPYRDIWDFYDEMLNEFFNQQGFNENQIKEFKHKRNNVFRDLSQVYKEPLYESDGD